MCGCAYLCFVCLCLLLFVYIHHCVNVCREYVCLPLCEGSVFLVCKSMCVFIYVCVYYLCLYVVVNICISFCFCNFFVFVGVSMECVCV